MTIYLRSIHELSRAPVEMNPDFRYRSMTFGLLLLGVLLLPSSARSDDRSVEHIEIYRSSREIVVSFTIRNFLDERVDQTVNNGLSAQVDFTVELWRDRNTWFDEWVASEKQTFRLYYDVWREEYQLIRGTSVEKVFSSIDSLFQNLSDQEDFAFEIGKLTGRDLCYVTVKAELKPFTVKEFNELRRWVSGKIQTMDAEDISDERSVKNSLMNGAFTLVKNFTGFGDIVVQGKSESFYCSGLPRRD